jgi:DNA repair protein RadC
MYEQMPLPRMPRAKRGKSAGVPQVRVVVVREEPEEPRPILQTPEDVRKLALIEEAIVPSDREQFVCLHLSTKNHLVSWEITSVGSLNATIVHPREVFKGAILANAASVILCHNHPSGDPEPSGADLQLTRRLVKAGDVIGIDVLDHVVVTETGFVSLREQGMM